MIDNGNMVELNIFQIGIVWKNQEQHEYLQTPSSDFTKAQPRLTITATPTDLSGNPDC